MTERIKHAAPPIIAYPNGRIRKAIATKHSMPTPLMTLAMALALSMSVGWLISKFPLRKSMEFRLQPADFGKGNAEISGLKPELHAA